MKKITLAILLIVYGFNALAQSSITGQIVDETGSPIPFAHLLLFQAAEEEVFLKGIAADATGRFDLSHNFSDVLYLRVQALGYTDHITESFAADRKIQLGTLVLKTNTATLDEVVVIAQKPLFEQRIDRTIVNVQGSVTLVGNNVLNVLSKSPAVRVNRSTNEISMMGKQGVLLMLDNKQLRMEADELMNLLESLPADNIATIELITAPPASYDAQGNAGVININTLRGREGLSGQFSANAAYGKRPKLGGSLNLSYQKGKVYTYANISSSVAYDLEKVSIHTGSSELGVESDLWVVRKPRTGLHTAELGLDFQLTPQTVIGGIFSTIYSDWEMHSLANSKRLDNGINSITDTRSYEENKLFRTLTNFNIRHTFSDRTELSADLDLIQFERKNPTAYEVVNTESGAAERFFSNATTPVTVQVLKSDIKHQLNEHIRLEAGIKGTFSDFNNHVNVAFEQDGILVDDPAFTDVFEMDERIYAAYVSTDWEVNPELNLKAGLRYEYYDLKLLSEHLGEISSRNQGNLFPSVHLSYRLSEQREVGLSYVNRIQRPGFLILAPYFYFFDRNTLFTGNPTILPARSNQFQLIFSGSNITTNLQYMQEALPVFDQQPTLDKELGLFVVRPVQGRTNRVLTLNVTYPLELTSWWNGRFNLLASHLNQHLTINEIAYKKSSYNFEASTTQNWSIRGILDVELTAGYYSPFYSGVMKMLPRTQVDLGVRKRLKSGAAFTFNVNDIFNTGTQWPMESDLDATGIFYKFNFDGEGPVFRFNFSMPLGNQNVSVRNKRSSGSEEEQNRLN